MISLRRSQGISLSRSQGSYEDRVFGLNEETISLKMSQGSYEYRISKLNEEMISLRRQVNGQAHPDPAQIIWPGKRRALTDDYGPNPFPLSCAVWPIVACQRRVASMPAALPDHLPGVGPAYLSRPAPSPPTAPIERSIFDDFDEHGHPDYSGNSFLAPSPDRELYADTASIRRQDSRMAELTRGIPQWGLDRSVAAIRERGAIGNDIQGQLERAADGLAAAMANEYAVLHRLDPH